MEEDTTAALPTTTTITATATTATTATTGTTEATALAAKFTQSNPSTSSTATTTVRTATTATNTVGSYVDVVVASELNPEKTFQFRVVPSATSKAENDCSPIPTTCMVVGAQSSTNANADAATPTAAAASTQIACVASGKLSTPNDGSQASDKQDGDPETGGPVANSASACVVGTHHGRSYSESTDVDVEVEGNGHGFGVDDGDGTGACDADIDDLAAMMRDANDGEMTPGNSIRSIGSLVCRICHNCENPATLVSPCLCKGSLTYVHIECLERWITTSRSTICELCQFRYNTEQTLRYTCLQSLRMWYSRSMSRRALQEDCQMFSLLTLVAFGIIGTLLVGIQYYILQEETWGLARLWTKGWLIFFLLTTLAVYLINTYMIVRSQLVPWYRWWQSARDIKLILENRKPLSMPSSRRSQNRQLAQNTEEEEGQQEQQEQQQQQQQLQLHYQQSAMAVYPEMLPQQQPQQHQRQSLQQQLEEENNFPFEYPTGFVQPAQSSAMRHAITAAGNSATALAVAAVAANASAIFNENLANCEEPGKLPITAATALGGAANAAATVEIPLEGYVYEFTQ